MEPKTKVSILRKQEKVKGCINSDSLNWIKKIYHMFSCYKAKQFHKPLANSMSFKKIIWNKELFWMPSLIYIKFIPSFTTDESTAVAVQNCLKIVNNC